MIEKNRIINVNRKKNKVLHGNAARVDPKEEIRNNYVAQAYYQQDGHPQPESKGGREFH